MLATEDIVLSRSWAFPTVLSPGSHVFCMWACVLLLSIVYPGAEAITQMEDTQPLETPIIAPVKAKQFEIVEREMPRTTFGYEYA